MKVVLADENRMMRTRATAQWAACSRPRFADDLAEHHFLCAHDPVAKA
jgi:hypothetical protein